MKCPRCDGNGSVPYHISDDLFDETNCPLCGGSGEVMTNEEWFCQLPTEEKAKVILKKTTELRLERKWSERYIEEWLKQPHTFE